MAVTLPITIVFTLISDSLLLLYLIIRLILNFFTKESSFLPFFSPSLQVKSLLQRYEHIKFHCLSKFQLSILTSGHYFGVGMLLISLFFSVSGCTLFIFTYVQFNNLRYFDSIPYLLWKAYDASVKVMVPYTNPISFSLLFSISEWLIHAALVVMDLGIGLILILHLISSSLLDSSKLILERSTSSTKEKLPGPSSPKVSKSPVFPTKKLHSLVYFYYLQFLFSFTLLISFTVLCFLDEPSLFPGLPVYSVWTTIDHIIFGLFLLLALKLLFSSLFSSSNMPSKPYLFIASISTLFCTLDHIMFYFFPATWNDSFSYLLQYSTVLISTIPKIALILIFFHLPIPYISAREKLKISAPFDLFPQLSNPDSKVTTTTTASTTTASSSSSSPLSSPPPPVISPVSPPGLPPTLPLPPLPRATLLISTQPFAFDKSQPIALPSVPIGPDLVGPTNSSLKSPSPEVPDSYPTTAFSNHSRPPRTTLSWIRRTHGE